ncbi:MAG: hypothetical protein PHT30_03825 [Bacilli bacterium]|nr:hypothetical protein [Bacilli bacterium]
MIVGCIINTYIAIGRVIIVHDVAIIKLAVSVFKEVLSELLDTERFDKTLGKIVAGLIGGLVEFKECNGFGVNNIYKAPIWDKWERLLNGVASIVVRNQAKEELSIAAKHQWIVTYAGSSLAKIFLAYPEQFHNLIAFAVINSLEKVNNSTVSAVNKFRKRFGKDLIDIDSAMQMIESTFGNCRELNPYLIEVLRLFNPLTGELKQLPESEKSP